MSKLFLIARSNMRKAKGQSVAIVVLIFLASLMLNLWLMLSMDYKANFVRYHDALNAEHVTLAVDNYDAGVSEYLSDTLARDKRVDQFRLDSCMHTVGTFPYNGGMMNGEFIFMDKPTAISRSIGRSEIVEESDLSSGIYLPMLYKSDEYSVGKTIEISIGNNVVSYTVCGFFNNVMMGSHNCALTQIILTQDKYAELKTLGFASEATLCSIRLIDMSDNLNYEAAIKALVTERFHNAARMRSNCYDIVTQSRYISQMICSGVMSAMAFFVLCIAIVVIVSNIVNYIQTNIKNLGVLKSVGYTSRQLIGSLLLQLLSLTLLASLSGTGVSYCLFPAVNAMMISQTGIPYAMRFLPLPFIISLLILCFTIALTVWLCARKIKKIEPITALRSGVQTHSFKRNYVPLDKTKAPLNLALALKSALSGIKHNITVCITMLVLSLIVVFSGLMTENVIADMTPFLDLIVGETADGAVNINADFEDDFLASLDNDSRIDKIYLYSSSNISHVGGAELMATFCDDFSKVNNQGVIFQGRFPKYFNEIAIAGKYAKERGLSIGSEIEITCNGKSEKYLISGFTQITNNLGRDCLLTRQGYERLGELDNVTYYFNLSDGVDIDAFNAEIKDRFSGSVNVTINIDETVEAASGVYVRLMTIIVVAILALSALIILFVLYLLVRTMLNNKMRDYGVLKSLGFTTGQLILQTALSFMPAIVISTVVGLIIGSFIINPLIGLLLSGIGIIKCSFTVPVAFITIAGLVLIILSFCIACLLSLKIKRIAPRNLLVAE
ncbi:MAG: ABC transporter permease [Clostridia bacterium]|nr:ABC transporter permease [Clostridia bacterium]